jgi:acyl-CoA reductase-like NAD-dependent aldehyde dehydrogenase
MRTAVVDRLVDLVATMSVGDAMNPATKLGPLISAAHLRSVAAHVDAAVAKGASLACGGEIEGAAGNFMRATVLTDVDVNQLIAREEVFGPVLAGVHRTEDRCAGDEWLDRRGPASLVVNATEGTGASDWFIE